MKKLGFVISILVFGVFLAPSTLSRPKNVTADDVVFSDNMNAAGQLQGNFTVTEEFYIDYPINKADDDSAKLFSPQNCTNIQNNGRADAKLDIVFVPVHQYPDVGDGSKFANDVDNFIEEFYDFPQFADNMQKINFHRIDNLDINDGCESHNQNPICDRNRVVEIASQCSGFDIQNNDQIVVIFDNNTVPVSYARAEPDYNTILVASNRSYYTMHEFGHSFAKLGDEYNYGAPVVVDPWFPNCANDTVGYTCEEKWGDKIGQDGVGCFETCGPTNWYRPTYSDSVMRNIYVDHFDPVSTPLVDNLLSIYSDRLPKPIRGNYIPIMR
jgi:hypothetical protein